LEHQSEFAMAQAKAAAGDRNVLVHGGYTIERSIAAALFSASANDSGEAAWGEFDTRGFGLALSFFLILIRRLWLTLLR
jgi:hypothetical protein